MLCMEPRVPVHLGKVEFEGAATFPLTTTNPLITRANNQEWQIFGQSYHFSECVVLTSEQLHLEKAKLGVDALQLVDHRLDLRVFLFWVFRVQFQ